MDDKGREAKDKVEPIDVDGDSLKEGETKNNDIPPKKDDEPTPSTAGANGGASTAPPIISPKTVSSHNYGLLSLANGTIIVSVPNDEDYYDNPGTKRPIAENVKESSRRGSHDAKSDASTAPGTRQRPTVTRRASIIESKRSFTSNHPQVRLMTRNSKENVIKQVSNLAEVPDTKSDEEFPILGNNLSNTTDTHEGRALTLDRQSKDGTVLDRSHLSTRCFVNAVKKMPKTGIGKVCKRRAEWFAKRVQKTLE